MTSCHSRQRLPSWDEGSRQYSPVPPDGGGRPLPSISRTCGRPVTGPVSIVSTVAEAPDRAGRLSRVPLNFDGGPRDHQAAFTVHHRIRR